MYEQKNVVDVFTLKSGEKAPEIEKIQTISTMGPKHKQIAAACCMRFSEDEQYMYCGNAGDETVSIFKRDKETGMLELLCSLPVSGEYPKDIAVFPDNQHIAVMNHESGNITFFRVDYEKGLLVMCAKEIKCNQPNSCVIVRVAP